MKPTRITQPPTPPAQAIWTEDNATNGSVGWRVLATADSDDVEVGVFWENLSRANAAALAAALIAASEWRGEQGWIYEMAHPINKVWRRNSTGVIEAWNEVTPEWRRSIFRTREEIVSEWGQLTIVAASDLTDAQRVAL